MYSIENKWKTTQRLLVFQCKYTKAPMSKYFKVYIEMYEKHIPNIHLSMMYWAGVVHMNINK